MPRIVQHNPAWLRRPSPGHDLFFNKPDSAPSASPSDSPADAFQTNAPPPARKIAVRRNEIFVANHNELRWASVRQLSKSHGGQSQGMQKSLARSVEDDAAAPYRILKVPVHDEIRQLALSQNSSYLAIATAHTVHIALLPDSYHLSSADTGPIKLKTFQVGPTTHVIGCSRTVSILWHPLGVDGSCLTTITEDATVRLWEFERQNRMSVNTAALAIDLKRLANGTAGSENFSPPKFGTANFSAEMPYMEVSAACYAGAGGSDLQRDAGWATTTLWLGMKDGGLYALCPIVPSKFAASPKMLDELAATTCLTAAELDEGDVDDAKEDMRAALDQLNWINGVEKHHRGEDFDVNLTVFNRPSKPSPIPMLQGPYRTEPEPDALFDITDIFVIPRSGQNGNVDEDGFEIIGGNEAQDEEHIPVDAVCIATSDARIHICFDLQGATARWLPAHKGRDKSGADDVDEFLPELLLVDSIEVSTEPTLGRPMFTSDAHARACFFVTHSQGVTYVSLAELMQKISAETQRGAEAGGSFRLKLALEQGLAVDALIRLPRPHASSPDGGSAVPSACVALLDSNLGDIVLTESLGEPFAVELDYNDDEFIDSEIGGDLDMDGLAGDEPVPRQGRDTYAVPQEFYAATTLPSLMRQYVDKHPRRQLRDKVRITEDDENLLTQAHAILSSETHRINDAVSRMFERTERLCTEFKAQLKRANEARNKIEDVVDDYDTNGMDGSEEPINSGDKIEQRLERAQSRQEELQERFEALRQQMGRVDKRPLTSKEKDWIRQVEEIDEMTGDGEGDEGEGQKASHRLGRVRALKHELGSERAQAMEEGSTTGVEAATSPGSSRRVGSAAIRNMLERERAMVEATRKKLDELLGARVGE